MQPAAYAEDCCRFFGRTIDPGPQQALAFTAGAQTKPTKPQSKQTGFPARAHRPAAAAPRIQGAALAPQAPPPGDPPGDV